MKSYSRPVLPDPGTALLTEAGSLDDAVAAGHAGATMIEIGHGGPALDRPRPAWTVRRVLGLAIGRDGRPGARGQRKDGSP